MEETQQIQPLNNNTNSPVPSINSHDELHTNLFKNTWNISILVLIFVLVGTFFAILAFDNIKKTPPFVTGDAFEGSWKTPGLRDSPSKLTIISVTSNIAQVKYAWGKDYSLSGIREATILLNEKILKWNNNTIYFTFKLMDDGSLQGTREGDNKTSTIKMIKTK